MSQRDEIDVVVNRMMRRLGNMPTKGDFVQYCMLSFMAIVLGVVWAMVLIK